MISRSHRFRGRKSINEVHRRGSGPRGVFLGVKALPNAKHGTYRVAIVVSKKISKSAVVRNRIRRRLFACLRQEEFKNLGSCDVVVTVFSAEILKEPQAKLISHLQKLLTQAGAFK